MPSTVVLVGTEPLPNLLRPSQRWPRMRKHNIIHDFSHSTALKTLQNAQSRWTPPKSTISSVGDSKSKVLRYIGERFGDQVGVKKGCRDDVVSSEDTEDTGRYVAAQARWHQRRSFGTSEDRGAWPRRPAWRLREANREPTGREEPDSRLAFTACPSGAAMKATSSGSAGGHVCCLDPRRPT